MNQEPTVTWSLTKPNYQQDDFSSSVSFHLIVIVNYQMHESSENYCDDFNVSQPVKFKMSGQNKQNGIRCDKNRRMMQISKAALITSMTPQLLATE